MLGGGCRARVVEKLATRFSSPKEAQEKFEQLNASEQKFESELLASLVLSQKGQGSLIPIYLCQLTGLNSHIHLLLGTSPPHVQVQEVHLL